MGSSNLTYNSFNILCETNAFFRNGSPVVKELQAQLKKEIEYSMKINENNIPKYNKLLAWIEELFI